MGPVPDYHPHLRGHGPNQPLHAPLAAVAAHCAQATAAGVTAAAITEHLHRVRQADAALRGWWDDDENPALRRSMVRYWDEELGADLDHYVDVVLAAKDAGLPVVLGLEVDHYAGRMHTVAELL